MYNYYNAWNPVIISIYFTVVVVIGAFFLLNLLLAVLWVYFEQVHKETIKKAESSNELAVDEKSRPMSTE